METERPLRRDPANAVPVVLSVGRLVEKKGHDSLIRAVAVLRDVGVDVRLRIAGEGPEWPTLQRLIHELALADRVAFLGPLTPAEVELEYAGADIFALACRKLIDGDRDGIPNVVLEAMAHGLPVVSTALAGVAEAVADETTGLLAPPDDPRALAALLRRLIESCELREILGSAGRVRVAERFGRAGSTNGEHQASRGQAARWCALQRLQRGSRKTENGDVAACVAAEQFDLVLRSIGCGDGEV